MLCDTVETEESHCVTQCDNVDTEESHCVTLCDTVDTEESRCVTLCDTVDTEESHCVTLCDTVDTEKSHATQKRAVSMTGRRIQSDDIEVFKLSTAVTSLLKDICLRKLS